MKSDYPKIMLDAVSKVYQMGKQVMVPAVKGINLRVDDGELVVITGRSGSGKTTLLNLVSGLTRPTSGEVRLEGIEVWKLPDAQQALLRNRKIGFIFQFPSLMPSLTTLENVILPTIVENRNHQAQVMRKAKDLLDEVGLTSKLLAYPRQLSAGEQQRVVIARSLVNKPELLLADEPTSNLDEKTEREIMELIQNIHREKGITILLVTHTKELVTYGTRSVHMVGGEIVGGQD